MIFPLLGLPPYLDGEICSLQQGIQVVLDTVCLAISFSELLLCFSFDILIMFCRCGLSFFIVASLLPFLSAIRANCFLYFFHVFFYVCFFYEGGWRNIGEEGEGFPSARARCAGRGFESQPSLSEASISFISSAAATIAKFKIVPCNNTGSPERSLS